MSNYKETPTLVIFLQGIAGIYLVFSIIGAFLIQEKYGEIRVKSEIYPFNTKTINNEMAMPASAGTVVQGIIVFFILFGLASTLNKASDVEADTQDLLIKFESLDNKITNLLSNSADKQEEDKDSNIDSILNEI